MKPINITNEKIAALRKKESALKSALAAALVEAQRAKAKELKRDFADIGETLCRFAWETPAFHLTLKQMLAAASTVADEHTRLRMSRRGWL